MADRADMPPDPVTGLIDFPLPREVSLWPQTWEARLSVVVLLIAVIAGIWSFARHRCLTRYRREALSELRRIGRAQDGSREQTLASLALLVRRTALAGYPREQVAPLFGPHWLDFLDRGYGGTEFSQGVGRLLVSGPYQQSAPTKVELQSLIVLVRRWIRGHHA
ncbi:DUF4381 domain-containing protein [Bradyrhizobium sp. AC87j1]|uniref:DUF4381 domain-containing protein n=1 Tax=Bradyrhizobium sp. AC87j1 TaxID=2055894 RepID=UPI001375084B|nr:DUF4381 domain-containing protein [Bradyrhizobium sp. AC87j1]